jgi:hypothetical protein
MRLNHDLAASDKSIAAFLLLDRGAASAEAP